MKSKKNKKKTSGKIRWKLFFAVLIPTLVLIVILWVLQTMFLGLFYGSIKEDELKQTAKNVVSNLYSDDINNRILFLSSNGDINIRVIETHQFSILYSTGDVFDSVMYGIGSWGMLEIYNDAKANNGELVRYYSETQKDVEKDNRPNIAPEISAQQEEIEKPNLNDEEMRKFRQNFKMVPQPGFFENVGRHNDLLYALITQLDDGTEVMVVADTRISPLDSTVKALKHQLYFCTAITVVVALAVSYFMSKKIAKPIEKINKSARHLAQGNFEEQFDARGYREIEELSNTLNYASTELGKVEKLRHELLANVSHDMRTPLTMIVGYGEMMRDIPGENTPENVQVIIDEAKRLSEFVNNVLDLSKLERGMESINKTKVNLTQFLEEAVVRYKNLLPEESLDIRLDFDEKAYVICDETKITQALFNLIDNAINYAEEPKKVGISQRIINGNTVRIEIKDNGVGISHEQLGHIWDRYYRNNKNHRRNTVGSGIGLSIVKEIFTQHEMKFGVETKQNEGSTFWFELDIVK